MTTTTASRTTKQPGALGYRDASASAGRSCASSGGRADARSAWNKQNDADPPGF